MSVIKEAIADAKLLRSASLENAKQKLNENFKDRLVQNFNQTLNELQESEEDEDLDEGFDMSFLSEEDEDETEEAPAEGGEDEEEGADLGADAGLEGGEDAGADAGLEGGEAAGEGLVSDMTQEALIQLIQSAMAGGIAQDTNLDAQPDVSDETNINGAEGVQAPDDLGSEVDDLDEIELDELLAEGDEVEDEDEIDLDESATAIVKTDPNVKQLNESIKKLKSKVASLSEANKIYKQSINESVVDAIKLKYLNLILAENVLNDDNKVLIAEKMDNAKTKDQAKFIYESVTQIMSAKGKNKAKSKVKPTQKISENLNRTSNPTVGKSQNKVDSGWDRMLELAGVKK